MAALQTEPKDPEPPIDDIPGYNAWIATEANSTYVINRKLLNNITKPATEHVVVADGSAHPIEASGTLLGHPSIHADYVPTFTQNLIGVSPILDIGAIAIIHNNKIEGLLKRRSAKKCSLKIQDQILVHVSTMVEDI
jgi:hypothetical protein